MVAVNVDVKVTGPFFQNAPAKAQAAIGDIMQDAVEAGEQHLDEMLRPRPAGVYLAVRGPAGSKGNYRHQVQGKVVGHLHAMITDGGCVYGPWLEGVGSRNATTRFKGYSFFRKTSQWLQKEVVNIANKALKRLVQRLS